MTILRGKGLTRSFSGHAAHHGKVIGFAHGGIWVMDKLWITMFEEKIRSR